MELEQRIQVAFHLTGKRLGAGLESPEGLRLRPALFAPFRDLTRLRYDYPLVLVDSPKAEERVRSLSRLMDSLLQKIAPVGFEGERMRSHVLRLERQIRHQASTAESMTLSKHWEVASTLLVASGGAGLQEDLQTARKALEVDGLVVDCDPAMPRQVVTHLWRAVQQAKVAKLNSDLERLMVKMTGVLKSSLARSEEGFTPAALRASFGSAHQSEFDFDAMSKLLSRTATKTAVAPRPSNGGGATATVAAPSGMSDSRNRRVRQVLAVLEKQRPTLEKQLDQLVFTDCASALQALRDRLPALGELLKAMAMAELEVEGRYQEAEHDVFFQKLDRNSVSPQELIRFPDWLVCLEAGKMTAQDSEHVMELLSLGLPVKVLVCCDDLLAESPVGAGHVAFGTRGARLASMAMGLNEAMVVQSTSSNLYQMRASLAAGLASSQAALFSVFAPPAGEVASYLLSAAAMHSRAFPAFVYDPTAGNDLASRFFLAPSNPQPEADWAVEKFSYEDRNHQRVEEEMPFTFVDLVASDPRHTRHFAVLTKPNGQRVSVGEWLARPRTDEVVDVPELLMVDSQDLLHRVIADDAVVQAARRCLQMWRTLQELAGIHNSHARKAVEAERKVWEEKLQAAVAAPAAEAAPAEAVAEAAPTGAAPAPAAPAQRDPDEAYIETPRCSTCNECTNINPRMFKYNENKQAYIADITAGTYAQLVAAAESCQVAIIHPGKPRNPDEPGLDELLKRAESFR